MVRQCQDRNLHPFWRVLRAWLYLGMVLVLLEVSGPAKERGPRIHQKQLPAGFHVPGLCPRFQVNHYFVKYLKTLVVFC